VQNGTSFDRHPYTNVLQGKVKHTFEVIQEQVPLTLFVQLASVVQSSQALYVGLAVGRGVVGLFDGLLVLGDFDGRETVGDLVGENVGKLGADEGLE
jgi:hypothetical protein